MSDWTDPSFEKIYNESEVSSGIDGFVSIDTQLKRRKVGDVKFSNKDLAAIQQYFRNLMRYRCRRAEGCLKWIDQNEGNLPAITNELLAVEETQRLTIPGMYGGFSYCLFERDGTPVLITDRYFRLRSIWAKGQQPSTGQYRSWYDIRLVR